jgi:hypothetical protein
MLRFYYIILSALSRFYYNFTFSDLTFSISRLMGGGVNCEYLYDTVQLWFLLSFFSFPIEIAWHGLGGQCVNRDSTELHRMLCCGSSMCGVHPGPRWKKKTGLHLPRCSTANPCAIFLIGIKIYTIS